MNNGCRPLNDNEIEQLKTKLSPRDQMLLHLGSRTGFRISELLSIKISSLLEYNELKEHFTLEKRNTKGKISSRTIPLSQSLRSLLKDYLQQLPSDQVYLFESARHTRLSRIQAWRVIHNAVTKLLLTGKIATHSMRKSFAQNMYERLDRDLAKLQYAMGHASINSTVKYISFTNTEVDDIIKTL
jgi:site-specific recombinase XerD